MYYHVRNCRQIDVHCYRHEEIHDVKSFLNAYNDAYEDQYHTVLLYTTTSGPPRQGNAYNVIISIDLMYPSSKLGFFIKSLVSTLKIGHQAEPYKGQCPIFSKLSYQNLTPDISICPLDIKPVVMKPTVYGVLVYVK